MFKNKKSTDFASQVESLSANKATSLTSSVKDTNAGAKAPESFAAAATEELSGYVMKFNAKEGYGFVKGADGVDYFFRIENFDGKGELPAPGRYVKFTVSNKARQMGKAPKIAAMRFDEAKAGEAEDPTADGDESRVRCPHCGKLMVPKVVFYHGSPEESICPFCLRTLHVVHYPPLFSKKNIFVFLVFLALAWIFCFGGLQFIIDKSHYYDSTQHFIDFLNTDVAEESKNNPVFEKEFSSNPDFWKLIKTDSNYCSKLNVSFVMCLKLKYFSNN